jgi:mono/diheme cytochrome c family protein
MEPTPPMRIVPLIVTAAAFALGVRADRPVGDPAAAGQLERTFRETVQPFVQTYCVSCHGWEKPKGELDLTPYGTWQSVAKDYPRWAIVLEQIESGDMPPAKAKEQPTAEVRGQVARWIRGVRDYEAQRTAGDPGPVLARRLSNAEYDHTVRDLTGVDLRPTKAFPVDPANEAGFDNSGESLTMSPALVKKYLEAARRVADHAVLTPTGLEFAPHPVTTDTDRDKYCVNRIVDFYKRQRTDYADYFLAAWRFEHRAALGKPTATLADVAAEVGVSPRYLETVWATLTGPPERAGPLVSLQAMWRALPWDAGRADDVRAACERMRDFVVSRRAMLVPRVNNLTAPRVHNGSQPLVLWKNRQLAANRTRYTGGALKVLTGGLPDWTGVARRVGAWVGKDALRENESSFARFCAIFPDAFYVSERARVYLDLEREKSEKRTGRLLSAGFHSQMGYFRDDGPLYDLVLDDAQRRELDRLWQELDYITAAPVRQYTGFIWFERTDSAFLRDAEFDVFRAEDKDCTSEEKVRRLSEAYVAKAARNGASPVALEAMRHYFTGMSATFRWLERARVDAEPAHVAALQAFAEKAYRRPLSPPERDGVARFYRSLRKKDGLTHEDAVRDTITGVLMSPHFCYRVDLPGPGEGPARPLNDFALASRLSYFLWSSMPDQELLDRAAAGDLRQPEVLVAQARRMLRDPRARGLATEFGGNWLDFRRFEEHNAVDRERFKSFDDDLRRAMFEEPVRFIADLAGRDGSVLDLLYGDYTFVNAALARHYGVPSLEASSPAEWVRLDDARRYGRGGLLPMSVFLTKNAPGLRTSPVKRGYWVARRLLGEHIPAPPDAVPELPADEAKLGELTLRDALARHRADKSCATCHEKFDSLGLVFEGYGPVGERRELDLGGRPVDTRAAFPGGAGEGAGLDGLTRYLRDKRQDDFVDNFCRKLLAYALGRGLMPSDEQTVRAMRDRLAGDGYRFGGPIEVIVTSPQFLNKRGDAAAAAVSAEKE